MKKAKGKCRFCGGVILKRRWTQPLNGGLCPKDVYAYYACSKCLMRYAPEEVATR